MDVVYCSDKNYLAYCATSIISLLENNKDKEIIFHILGNKLGLDDKTKFKKIKDEFINSDFVFYDINDIEEKIKVRTKGYATSTFLRLFIGSMLPENIQKCLL